MFERINKINNRLEEILTGGAGPNANPGDMVIHTHVEDPANLTKPEAVLAYDRAATAAIDRLEEAIAYLKAYRMKLGERYVYLSTSPTVTVLRLITEPDPNGKTYYYLKYFKRYENGEEFESGGWQFSANERELAIREFNEHKKSHPGIIAEMNI